MRDLKAWAAAAAATVAIGAAGQAGAGNFISNDLCAISTVYPAAVGSPRTYAESCLTNHVRFDPAMGELLSVVVSTTESFQLLNVAINPNAEVAHAIRTSTADLTIDFSEIGPGYSTSTASNSAGPSMSPPLAPFEVRSILGGAFITSVHNFTLSGADLAPFIGPGMFDLRADGSATVNYLVDQPEVAFDGVTMLNFNASIQYIFDDALPPPGVPEPRTWAMLLLGFGAMGGVLRRVRRGLPA